MRIVNNTFKQAQKMNWEKAKIFAFILACSVAAFCIIYWTINPHISLTLTI